MSADTESKVIVWHQFYMYKRMLTFNLTTFRPIIILKKITPGYLAHWGQDEMAANSQTAFLNAFSFSVFQFSLKFVPSLVKIMAWCRPGNKPLSEPMMVKLLMHICITRLQWVKGWCMKPIPNLFVVLSRTAAASERPCVYKNIYSLFKPMNSPRAPQWIRQ